MKYKDLIHLCENSSSTRSYYLSLPVKTQMRVSEFCDSIHTAAELHNMVSMLEKYDRSVELSEQYDHIFGYNK